MLHNVLIITSSGLVVFSESWRTAQSHSISAIAGLVGALLRTIIELAHTTINLTLNYIEMDTIAVSITEHPELPVYCAVVIDRDAPITTLGGAHAGAAVIANKASSPTLGKLLSSRILAAFVDEHSAELEASVGGHSMSAFRGFSYRLPNVMRDCCRSMLRELLRNAEGCASALLLSDDGVTESAHREASTTGAHGDAGRRDVDDVAVMATVRPVLAAAAELGECRACIPISVASVSRIGLCADLDQQPIATVPMIRVDHAFLECSLIEVSS